MLNTTARQNTTPRTVLVVEDEPTLATAIAQRITAEGWTARVAGDGASAVQAASQLRPDLVIMDIMLMVMDGLEATKRIVAERPVPVLILTAREARSQRVEGLRLGADDYLCKPFALIEVAARLEALIRRAHGQSSSELRHGKVILDPNRLTASLDGESLALKPKEFALLELLMRNAGRVLPRKLIEEKLYTWDDEVSSNAVEVHVHHLRRKLGGDFIRTVHGIGYTLGDA